MLRRNGLVINCVESVPSSSLPPPPSPRPPFLPSIFGRVIASDSLFDFWVGLRGQPIRQRHSRGSKALVPRLNKVILKNFIPEPPPSVDRPNFFLFQAWFIINEIKLF